MEFNQERSNCRQFNGNHKLKCQRNITKILYNNSPYNRSIHNIKSKTVDGHKCKKCKEKNKDNNESIFNEKENTEHIQQTHNNKEITICNNIKSSEAVKYKERINKGGLKIETRKKKEGNMIVFGETCDLKRTRYNSTKNKKQIQKHLKVTFSDQSDLRANKQNKKWFTENPYIRQKNTLQTMSKLYSKQLIKESEILKMKNINKQDEPVQVKPESSNFSTSTKDSIKDLHSYMGEMNIIKHNNQMVYPLINIRSVEENVNNIIDIYESSGKLKTEKPGGAVGDTEKLQCQPQKEKESITKHKNFTEKEYLLTNTAKQIDDIISNRKKKKNRFSNTSKDGIREEKEKLKNNRGIKPADTTFTCDIYENSIGEVTPRSQRSLSDSCLKFKTKMYKYKSRKNKILPTKYSSKNLPNHKQSKSLQNIKRNNSSNRFPETKSKAQELINFPVSKNSPIEAEKELEVEKVNINNTYPKHNSDNLLTSVASLNKINSEERFSNENQWCFADPELYSCDSELIVDDDRTTINSSAPTGQFISPRSSNDLWSNEKICKSSASVFEINSIVSLDDLNEKCPETNNTLECSNGQAIEPPIQINTIQKEYNNIKSNKNRYYKNEFLKNDPIIHFNKNVENNNSKRFPHQSAVTLISGFGSNCSLDNKKKSEGDRNQPNSSLRNIDISFNTKKDAAVSASTSYEIIRKTKFLRNKASMCYEAVPSKIKNQRRERLKKIQQNQRETKQLYNTLLRKEGEVHRLVCKPIPEILNEEDNDTIENNFFQHRKYRSIYSEKRQPRRSNKHHNSSNRQILQDKDEKKTDTYIRQEELEDVKIKFKDNFTLPCSQENVKPRQSKGFWNSLRTGGRRLVRFLQDSASLKYCFKKNIFK